MPREKRTIIDKIKRNCIRINSNYYNKYFNNDKQ